VAAAHEVYETDVEGHHKYLSYLIRWDGVTLFHAGDTVETPQQHGKLSGVRIDVGSCRSMGAAKSGTSLT